MFFQPLSIFARLEVIRKVNVLIFAGRLMTTTASRFIYAENSGSVGKLYGPFFLALKLLEPRCQSFRVSVLRFISTRVGMAS